MKASVYSLALCVCLQADLFPGALVYFGSDVKAGYFFSFTHILYQLQINTCVFAEDFNTTQFSSAEFYIKRDLLKTSVSALQADESIARYVESL